jgi:hypothetical protein
MLLAAERHRTRSARNLDPYPQFSYDSCTPVGRAVKVLLGHATAEVHAIEYVHWSIGAYVGIAPAEWRGKKALARPHRSRPGFTARSRRIRTIVNLGFEALVNSATIEDGGERGINSAL